MPLIFDMGLEPFLSGDTSNPLLNPGILRSVLAERRQVLKDIEDREFRKRMADFQKKVDLENLRLKRKQVGIDAKRADIAEKRLDIDNQQLQYEIGQELLQRNAANELAILRARMLGLDVENIPEETLRNAPTSAINQLAETKQTLDEGARRIAQESVAVSNFRNFATTLAEDGKVPKDFVDRIVPLVESGAITISDAFKYVEAGIEQQEMYDARGLVVKELAKNVVPDFSNYPHLRRRFESLLMTFQHGDMTDQQLQDGVSDLYKERDRLIQKESRSQLYESIGLSSELAEVLAETNVSPLEAIQWHLGKNISLAVEDNPELAIRVVPFIRSRIEELNKEIQTYGPLGVNSVDLIEQNTRGRAREAALKERETRLSKLIEERDLIDKQLKEIVGRLTGGLLKKPGQRLGNAVPFRSEGVQAASPEVEPEVTNPKHEVQKYGDTYFVVTPKGRWRINRVPGTMDDAMALSMKILGREAPQEELIELAKVIWSATR